jgi:hypothetical protein
MAISHNDLLGYQAWSAEAFCRPTRISGVSCYLLNLFVEKGSKKGLKEIEEYNVLKKVESEHKLGFGE